MKHKNLALSLLSFFVISFIMFSIICRVQKTPFIDEIFHIPQTLKYCKGLLDEVQQFFYFLVIVVSPESLNVRHFIGDEMVS